jgi:hypothetical protein
MQSFLFAVAVAVANRAVKYCLQRPKTVGNSPHSEFVQIAHRTLEKIEIYKKHKC